MKTETNSECDEIQAEIDSLREWRNKVSAGGYRDEVDALNASLWDLTADLANLEGRLNG